MKNNKVRYKSMKKSSPMVQYKRFLLGKHYRNFKRAIAPIPGTLRKEIADAWNAHWEKMTTVRSRNITRKGTKHEKNI